MTTEPRSSRAQRLRRLFLLPTGRRRKARGRHAASTVVVPPRPTTPPPVPAQAVALDAVMRKLAQRTASQVAAHEGARVPVAAPAVAALAAVAPAPRLPAVATLPARRAAPSAPASPPAVKITTLGATPAAGVAAVSARLDPTDMPTMPILTPDEFLMTRGWDELFNVVKNDEVDTLSFTLRQGGATVRVSDTTIEIPKIPVEPEQVAHLCKHCHELHTGVGLGGRMWRCDECKMVAPY